MTDGANIAELDSSTCEAYVGDWTTSRIDGSLGASLDDETCESSSCSDLLGVAIGSADVVTECGVLDNAIRAAVDAV